MEEKLKNNESKISKNIKKQKIDFNFNKDKQLIYSAVFYICGLILGSSFYKSVTSETLDNLLKPRSNTLINLFLSNLCLYFALFLIMVFLGLCLIGYPIMNIVPAFLGVEYGLKISYFLVNYSVKGVGYAILMIVPFSAAFVTIVSYTLRISAQMSVSLINMTKEGSAAQLNIRNYLRQYAIMGAIIIAVSFISAGVTVLLFSVVTI